MEELLGLIALGVIFWFVYALYNPKEAVYWHESPSRIKAFGYLLLGMFVIGSLNPNAEDSETDSEETSTCEEISGAYRGLYETNLNDTGLGQLLIYPDCEYEMAEDIDDDGEFSDLKGKSVWTSGYMRKDGNNKYVLEDGSIVIVRNNVVRYKGKYARATTNWRKEVR